MRVELKVGYPLDQAGPLLSDVMHKAEGDVLAGDLTSSEYRRKSPLDSHREDAVKAWTTLCPDGNTFTPPLSVAIIQHGRSPVKKTPEKV